MPWCDKCGQHFHSLGFARHRAMHRDKERAEKKFREEILRREAIGDMHAEGSALIIPTTQTTQED